MVQDQCKLRYQKNHGFKTREKYYYARNRNDISEILSVSDFFVNFSFYEGLPV